ncbi:MAG: YdeI/OmpD-associated family protein [Candidatus Synoicihabitans palmerolidicus]|nr:YdeI/OmpD-associated family protein [Candidatus Synoicihabitans palmerolidicus]
MGNFWKIRSLSDLPSDADLVRFVREAALRITSPQTADPKSIDRKTPRSPPPDLLQALNFPSNAEAAATWRSFSPAKQRDYVEWLLDAKRESTRKRRLQTTLQWLAEGKSRNWKYASW